MWSGRSPTTFRGNLIPPFSGSKSDPSNDWELCGKRVRDFRLLHVGFLRNYTIYI
jgi:hypothetical protein